MVRDNNIRILATQYTLTYRSFDIYISGCAGPHCVGCHNPESWDFSNGDLYVKGETVDIWSKKILEFGSLVKNIMIFGGEPLDQNLELLEDMLVRLNLLNIPIWLFTRYQKNEIPQFVFKHCTYVKTGRYVESLKEENIQYGITLSTSNQKIYKKGVDY